MSIIVAYKSGEQQYGSYVINITLGFELFLKCLDRRIYKEEKQGKEGSNSSVNHLALLSRQVPADLPRLGFGTLPPIQGVAPPFSEILESTESDLGISKGEEASETLVIESLPFMIHVVSKSMIGL